MASIRSRLDRVEARIGGKSQKYYLLVGVGTGQTYEEATELAMKERGIP